MNQGQRTGKDSLEMYSLLSETLGKEQASRASEMLSKCQGAGKDVS